MAFVLFISFIILLRIGELILSRRNEIWLLQNGAIEYGQKHYPYIVALHVLFIVSLIIEYTTKQTESFSLFFFVLYFLFLSFKVWVITSLGKFWNTKIYHISGFPLIKKGVYKYVKHPNYLVVIAKIAIIPLVFHLYYTAITFTVLNAIILSVRVNEENKVMKI
ncbi:MAG TPA: isoprenylcysteine carboxylmethyltransferase family protein [Ignavibacteria bacterium]